MLNINCYLINIIKILVTAEDIAQMSNSEGMNVD